jgi:hypothetical protein
VRRARESCFSELYKLEEEMARAAGVKKKILSTLAQGAVSSTHGNVRAALKLTQCNRTEFEAALNLLVAERKVRVRRTATHITLSLRD